MKHEGFTVARLTKVLGIDCVRRGKYCITTIPNDCADKPLDLVNREFNGTTAKSTMGWRVLKTMQTQLILDALDRASTPLSVVLVIRVTAHWLKPSMACTEPKSSTKTDRGKSWIRLNLPHWIGLTGLITSDYCNPLVITVS